MSAVNAAVGRLTALCWRPVALGPAEQVERADARTSIADARIAYAAADDRLDGIDRNGLVTPGGLLTLIGRALDVAALARLRTDQWSAEHHAAAQRRRAALADVVVDQPAEPVGQLDLFEVAS